MTTDGARDDQVWTWALEDCFNPRYDATASPAGLQYGCEIQGPCCGYDVVATQSWDEFWRLGPPARVRMPAAVAAAISAHAAAHGYGRAPAGGPAR